MPAEGECALAACLTFPASLSGTGSLELGGLGVGANCGCLLAAPSWYPEPWEEEAHDRFASHLRSDDDDEQGHVGAGAQRRFPVSFSFEGVLVLLRTLSAVLCLPPFSILLA